MLHSLIGVHMHVFITGASGHVAAPVIAELLSAGHTVTGLARSDRAEKIVRARGADVRRGDIVDLDGLSAAAGEADGVIHLAFQHDGQYAGDLVGAAAADLPAVEAIGAALAGSGKSFVGTNATGALALGGFHGLLTETDVLASGIRIEAENLMVAIAQRNVRTSVVRLPPTVHSGGQFGFVSGLIPIARLTGVSGYLGDGANVWPSADTRDVARVYRLALESADPGSRLHAVAEEGIALRDIATLIGRRLDIPVTQIPADDAEQHFGFLTQFVGMNNPTSSKITRETIDWTPARPGLLTDLDDAQHFTTE